MDTKVLDFESIMFGIIAIGSIISCAVFIVAFAMAIVGKMFGKSIKPQGRDKASNYEEKGSS